MRFNSVLLFLFCALLLGCAAPQKKKTSAQNVHYILGVSYLQEGNASRALQEFHKARENDPDNVDALVGLGRAYQMRGAYGEAETAYLQALQLRDDDSLIANNLGSLYLDMQRPDDAIHYFTKAANDLMFANAEISLTGLGVAHFQKREYLQAVAAYRRALVQNPRYDEAHFRLGQAYNAMGQADRALGEFQQTLKLNGNHLQAHFHLGLAHAKADNPSEAVRYFRNVVRLAPSTELADEAARYLELLQ